ncbi:hypothetical protein DFH08DRAFT_839561 [Mycena albidolilacea]|uniref:Transmembrane protein n=1 Tax=Mycena albidolilacea TaxID=1033008 RepID=A0AAD7APX9_9AGAR|nr:hypothetical protein DFH08DRAFT_839561 [Mycena albidolilacea]
MSVLIDDSDPLVQYNSPGGWTNHGKPLEFNATTHTSETRGDTVTVVFEGTSIGVYGTLAPSTAQLRLNISIDGADLGSYNWPVVTSPTLHQLLWTSPVFEEASHKLVITLDPDPSSSNRAFFLDYFVYNTTSTAGKTLLIDDNHPGVTYSPGGWTFGTSDDSLQSTQHISTDPGAWAIVSFDGIGISVLASPNQSDDDFKASVVIDESPPAIVSLSPNRNLFDSSVLPPGPHTMNITVLSEDSVALDYFLVKTGSSVGSSPGPDGSAQPSAGVPSAGVKEQGSKTHNTAAIVGGAAVGCLVSLALILAFIFLRRRRAHVPRDNTQTASVMPRWAGHNDQSLTVPRSFRPELRDGATAHPHNIQTASVVPRWMGRNDQSPTIPHPFRPELHDGAAARPHNIQTTSVIPRWLGRNDQSPTTPRPFRPELHDGAAARPHNIQTTSVIPRWLGRNDQSPTTPRPFRPEFHDGATAYPPPYTLKYLPDVGQ